MLLRGEEPGQGPGWGEDLLRRSSKIESGEGEIFL